MGIHTKSIRDCFGVQSRKTSCRDGESTSRRNWIPAILTRTSHAGIHYLCGTVSNSVD